MHGKAPGDRRVDQDSWTKAYTTEPDPWFHDIFRRFFVWNLLCSFLKHEDQFTLQRAVMKERPALEPGDRRFRNIPNV